MVFLSLLVLPTAAGANNLHQSPLKIKMSNIRQNQDNDSTKSFLKVLSDHPGSATALTAKQKSEVRQFLAKAKAKGNRNLVCTGASLAGQRESMYRVVRIRAQLVCSYAKSIDPYVKTTVQEKFTSAQEFNGRVVVISK